jgi:hypothetical protein
MEYKKARYEELVKQRKACDICQMIHNPSRIEGGKYDTDHIGPWSAWKGDLDAEIVVVGKDWYPINGFIKQKGVSDPNKPTNKNLIKLLRYIGIDPQKDKLFFTNSVLCMKEGEAANKKLEDSWIKNCSTKFLRPLLDLIEPKIVIALGEDAFSAITEVYGFGNIKFSDAINKSEPIYLTEHMKCFPVYHCGQIPINRYGWITHFRQWDRIRPHLPETFLKDCRVTRN